MIEIYLGIGGNLCDRLKNIEQVLNLISERIAMPEKVSSVYLSEPWGFEHAKYFTNAVVMLRTNKTPDEIFTITTAIEQEMKRVRSNSGYQGRTMDIDILFYGGQIIENESLTVPHPKLSDRLFVLLPMCEISPDFIHPQLKKEMNQLLRECGDTGKIRKLNKNVCI